MWMASCNLKRFPGGASNQCCCICKWRLEAHMHKQFPHTEQFGWVCIGFAFMEGVPIAYLGDFEHGLCELFSHRQKST